jgi:hypothetical protein
LQVFSRSIRRPRLVSTECWKTKGQRAVTLPGVSPPVIQGRNSIIIFFCELGPVLPEIGRLTLPLFWFLQTLLRCPSTGTAFWTRACIRYHSAPSFWSIAPTMSQSDLPHRTATSASPCATGGSRQSRSHTHPRNSRRRPRPDYRRLQYDRYGRPIVFVRSSAQFVDSFCHWDRRLCVPASQPPA